MEEEKILKLFRDNPELLAKITALASSSSTTTSTSHDDELRDHGHDVLEADADDQELTEQEDVETNNQKEEKRQFSAEELFSKRKGKASTAQQLFSVSNKLTHTAIHVFNHEAFK